MKKNQKQSHEVSRREFLRGSAAAGVGAAIATGMPGVALASAEEPAEQVVQENKGYQLTSHVRQYYETLKS